jgi:hypothetical protein
MTIALYVAAYALIPLFGVSALRWSREGALGSRAGRLAFAFLAGALLLTIEATLFSIAGIRWSVPALALPLIAITVASLVVAPGTRARNPRPALAEGEASLDASIDPAVHASIPASIEPPMASRRHARAPTALLLLAVAHVALTIVTTQSVSPDYLLFWGVKAVRFAMARGIDAGFLFTGFSPPQPDYPPLVPVLQGWGVQVAGAMPWLTGAAMSAVWLLAAALVIRDLLAAAGAPRYAAPFWTLAMALSFGATGCGGNAEAMLIAYLSVGALAMALETHHPRCRWIVAIALAAAALTKAEALFAIGTLLVGVAVRDLVRRDRRGFVRLGMHGAAAIAGIGLWFAYQFRFGRAIGFHRFTSVKQFYAGNLAVLLREGPSHLGAGAWGLSWLLALAVVAAVAIRAPRRLVAASPLLLPVPLFFAFFVFLYLQYANGLSMQLAWTLGRISQPALSFLILGAALVSAPPAIESAPYEPR